MKEYKRRRYSGFFGKGKWVKDKFFDLPDEVNDFYRDGRDNYLTAMDGVIDTIANLVVTGLAAAHQRIQQGDDEVQAYVDALPDDLQSLGRETAVGLDHKFDELGRASCRERV